MIGFININKPINMTSAQVVAKIKHATHQKVGHFGTLDPLASGVLPIAISKATRLFDYFLNKTKIYIATAKFGFKTDTLDMGGEVIEKTNKIPNRCQIEEKLSSFLGKQKQMPPKFSAKKVHGKKAYELAREGVDFNLEPKEIEIFELKLLNFENHEATFYIHCSSGTYVRSFIRDIAESLDSLATTTSILRTQSGYFKIENSCTIEEFIKNQEKNIIKVEDVLDNLPKIYLTQDQTKNLLDGKTLLLNDKPNGTYLLFTNKNLVYGVADIVSKKVYVKAFLLEDINL